MKKFCLLCLPLVLLLAPTAEAQLFQYGGFRAYGLVTHYGLEDAEAVRQGARATDRYLERTSKIPLQLGAAFGFDCEIFNLPVDGKVQLEWKVTHPRMQDDAGKYSTGYGYLAEYEVVDGHTLCDGHYVLSNANELVAGTWTFEYWYKKTLLVKQSFDVGTPPRSE